MTVIFGMFFLVPVLGFLVFAVRYDIIQDEYLPLYILSVLVFSFLGFFMLRNIFDEIRAISKTVSRELPVANPRDETLSSEDELDLIVSSFRILEQRLIDTLARLDDKTANIAALKDLSELCYMTFNYEDLLSITLERALRLVEADVGSVMIVDERRESFVIVASIGLGEYGKKGSIIPFEDSVAKYAVINHSPLLVEDIEKDMRFARKSRSHYCTKSFICMPLKTMNDVIGVITISRRKFDAPFKETDVDVLTPLIGNAAFTYDNLRLNEKNKILQENVRTLAHLFEAMNARLPEEELRRMVMQEARRLLGVDLIVLLEQDCPGSDLLIMVDFSSSFPLNFKKGAFYRCRHTVFEKVFRQNVYHFVDLDDPGEIPEELFYLPGVLSCLIVPLRTEGVPTGVILIYNIDKKQWRQMAPLVDLVRETASLLLQHNRMISYVQRRTRELETLRLISDALFSFTMDRTKMMDYTMTMIKSALNVEAGFLALVEEGKIKFVSALHLDLDALNSLSLGLGEDIVGYVAHRGLSVLTNDARHHPHYLPVMDTALGFSARSALAVPIITQGKVAGVLMVFNKTTGPFNEEDREMLTTIAVHICIALDNARLYEESLTMTEKEREIRYVFQKFLPSEIAERIIQGEDKGHPVVEEYRTITFLNIDIRRFSQVTKRLGTQKSVALMNDFFAMMGEIVFEQGGRVDKYLGDGLLALFGAPTAGPGDADKAIRAAIAMKKVMPRFNEMCTANFGISLTMGISVHTGEAVVGSVGFHKKMDYTALGDSVNFVFKLQNLCKLWPNEILVSEATLRAAQSFYDVEQVGEFEVDPDVVPHMRIYRLLT